MEVVQRLYSDSVSRKDQTFLGGIPKGESEHPVQHSDQIVAMLLSLVSLLALYLLGYPTFISSMANWLPVWLIDLLNGISPFKYFQSISRGVIDTRDIIYFACFCGFFLYANAMMLNSRRRNG